MSRFIVLCGGEGSGKSTQLKRLQEKHPNFTFTREPGGSPFAEKIRTLALNDELSKQASALTQFSLMWASRHDNLKNIIVPALESGQSVICDRFDCCSYAYQIHGQGATKLENYFWQTRSLYLGEKVPSLYIYLDIDPAIGIARVAERKGYKESDHFDSQKLDFHNRVRAGYQTFLSRVPSVTIDASQSIETVSREIDNLIYVLSLPAQSFQIPEQSATKGGG